MCKSGWGIYFGEGPKTVQRCWAYYGNKVRLMPRCDQLTLNKLWCLQTISIQVIPSHGNPQMERRLYDCYLFKYCSVKYQTFHQVSEKTSHQTCSHQKTTWKAFQMPQRAIKHQLTCQIEPTSGSFPIGRRGILVIPRNRLDYAESNYSF